MAQNRGKSMPGKSKLNFFATFFATLMALCCAMAGLSLAAAEPATSAEQVIDALQKNYDSTIDFTADFRQQTEVSRRGASCGLNGPAKCFGDMTSPRAKSC